MEPVTHILTGACLSRTGLNRKAAYATLTMAIAAEFPDVDTLWSLRGPVEGFQHHRGITHTFLGLPFEAAFLVAVVYGVHRWRVLRAGKRESGAGSREQERGRVVKPLTAAPVRWGVLYLLALVALLSHLLLDYTNNYGLRPFLPFNDRWYAASIVFIFDPLMFALLLGALVAPWIFGLIGSEVGARRSPFRARGWAVAALVGVVGWWTLREVEHNHAVNLAMAQSIAAPVKDVAAQATLPNPGEEPLGAAESSVPGQVEDGVAPAEVRPVYLTAQRVLANPDPLSPFHWSTATDFGVLYQLAEVDTQSGAVTPGDTTFPKPPQSEVVRAAERSKLGRVYLDWSPMPIVNVQPPVTDVSDPDSGLTVVTFRDPRFMGGWLRDVGRSALTAEVGVNAAGNAVRETMDGRTE
jgi:inner membrane protein